MQGCAWAYRIRHLIGDAAAGAASVGKLITQKHLQKSDYLSKGERLNCKSVTSCLHLQKLAGRGFLCQPQRQNAVDHRPDVLPGDLDQALHMLLEDTSQIADIIENFTTHTTCRP